MADIGWLPAAITGVCGVMGGSLVARITGSGTLQVKAYETVASELKRVQDRSDKIESEFRTETQRLAGEVTRLNERVLALEIEKATLLTEHSRKERAWQTCEDGLNDRIHDLTVENERLDKANAKLRENQTQMIEYIKAHIDTTYNEGNIDILQIGDVEIDRRKHSQDRFRDRMDAPKIESGIEVKALTN